MKFRYISVSCVCAHISHTYTDQSLYSKFNVIQWQIIQLIHTLFLFHVFLFSRSLNFSFAYRIIWTTDNFLSKEINTLMCLNIKNKVKHESKLMCIVNYCHNAKEKGNIQNIYSLHSNEARIQEWLALSFSRGSSWPRDWTCVPCVSCTAGGSFTHWAIGEDQWSQDNYHHVLTVQKQSGIRNVTHF